MVSEDQHRAVGAGAHLVQPLQLVAIDPTAGKAHRGGVDDGQDDPGQLHPVGPAHAQFGVVIAPHPPQPLAEGALVEVEEGIQLGGPAGVGEVALGDDGVGRQRRHLGHGAPVHDIGIRVVAWIGSQDGTDVDAGDVQPATFGFAEMKVVDRRHGGQAFTGRGGARCESQYPDGNRTHLD